MAEQNTPNVANTINANVLAQAAQAIAALPPRSPGGGRGRPGIAVKLPAPGSVAEAVYRHFENDATALNNMGTAAGVGTHSMYRIWLCAYVTGRTPAERSVSDKDMNASMQTLNFGIIRGASSSHNNTMKGHGRITNGPAGGFMLAGELAKTLDTVLAAECAARGLKPEDVNTSAADLAARKAKEAPPAPPASARRKRGATAETK